MELNGKKNKNIVLKIDGKEYRSEGGKTVIQVCHENGIKVPHFCYHKDLSIAGNCRMCLVNVKGIPKPVISCATVVSEGMEVDTSSESVIKLRENIMEFLLINHPLDCPVCDKAGECTLQNYSYDYGYAAGRFSEGKVVKEVKDLGEHVKYWGSRCIVCTRCVRFTDEISGTGELSVVGRGDKSKIDIHPKYPINNALSMNVNDICPVGALVSADFLYEARVWNMSQKKSICNMCSVGCNVRVDALDNKIKRIVPMENEEVNKSFMCDYGRLNYGYIYSENRLKRPYLEGKEVSWTKAILKLKERFSDKEYVSGLGIVVSAWSSNEVLYMLKELRDKYLGSSKIYFCGNVREEDEIYPGFRISGDRNPNVVGIKVIYGMDVAVREDVDLGDEVKNLIYIGGIGEGYVPKGIGSVSKNRFEDIVVIDYIRTEFSRGADLELSMLSHYEDRGSYINDKYILQSFKSVIEPMTYGLSGSEILKRVIMLMGGMEGEEDAEFDAEFNERIYNKLDEKLKSYKEVSK